MTERSAIARLTDIVEASAHIGCVTQDVTLETFESDWQKRWLVERGVEIISEASRNLPDEIKARYPEIPWQKVAGIGNILRQDYERIAPAILWNLARLEIMPLVTACKAELLREKGGT